MPVDCKPCYVAQLWSVYDSVASAYYNIVDRHYQPVFCRVVIAHLAPGRYSYRLLGGLSAVCSFGRTTPYGMPIGMSIRPWVPLPNLGLGQNFDPERTPIAILRCTVLSQQLQAYKAPAIWAPRQLHAIS